MAPMSYRDNSFAQSHFFTLSPKTRRLNPAGFLSFTTDGQRCVELQRRICLRRSRICSISQNAQTKQALKQATISKNRKALLASAIALMDIAMQQACHEVRAIKWGADLSPRPHPPASFVFRKIQRSSRAHTWRKVVKPATRHRKT
jgi:hypothetical protein